MTTPQTRDDRGIAMILVIIYSAVLLLMVLIVGQATLATVRASDTNETSFRALSAAEAGIDDYRARIALAGTPAGVTSPALTGWVTLPGSASEAYYTYSLVPRSNAAQTGEITIRSTGRVDGVERTIEATLRKRTSYDYAYVSGSETVPWNFPGAYSGKGGELTPEQAQSFCRDHWYDPALKSTATSELGPHRNSRICEYIAVNSGDRWYGNVHTNDTWYFAPGLADVFAGAVTTSCVPGDGSNGCPTGQRWIDPAVVPQGNAANPSDYTLFEIPSVTPVAWNPEYASPLEFPPDPTGLRTQAQAAGCYFTGPTRIRWFPGGVMVVTSPDTTDASINAFCREAGKSYYAANPSTQTTMVLSYAAMKQQGFNGVIYVDSTTDPAAPSCQTKTSKSIYPFVIPSSTTYSERATYSFPPSVDLWKSGKLLGFPVESTTVDDPWSAGFCGKGTAYIQGAYRGELTLATAHDISVTGQLWDENLSSANWQDPLAADYGVPPTDSLNTLGLIPQRYMYVYLPKDSYGGNTWQTTNLNNLVIDAAALVLNGCFAVQDWDTTVSRGILKFVGSLAQANRCSIEKPSGNGGYAPFAIYYDERLSRTVSPPYLADLFTEPWSLVRESELRPGSVLLPSFP